MNHFKGLNETERYHNEMMEHARKQTQLLEQIAQLLQQQKGDGSSEFHSTAGIPVDNLSQGQQGQRHSNGGGNRRGRKPALLRNGS